jgi:hypothetical protein
MVSRIADQGALGDCCIAELLHRNILVESEAGFWSGMGLGCENSSVDSARRISQRNCASRELIRAADNALQSIL